MPSSACALAPPLLHSFPTRRSSDLGVHLSDGATNILPVGPHRASEGKPLTAEQLQQNRDAVHGAWRLGFNDNMHSLRTGFYQGWDLRSEEHTSELQSRFDLVCRLLLAPSPPHFYTLSLHDALPISAFIFPMARRTFSPSARIARVKESR